MWLSMLSVLASLLTLVASQSCPDPSENSASWVRLKPLGQCKDGESTCPYRITLPPLTVQLPKPFRELEKMARELQSLTQMVNQLKEDCRECKERKGMDWNIQTDHEAEDGERIQASRGTLKTRERQQDIVKRERTVKVTTSGAVAEDTTIISSDAKDVNPTAFGKQRNTNQKWNVNPNTTKTMSETNGGPKRSNPLQKNPISRSISKVEEVPSPTTTKKKILQSPMTTLTESSFPGDLDSEQPTEQEKQVGPEIYPSGSLTAKGKVKSIPEYHAVSIITEDNDDDVDDDDYDDDEEEETKQLQTPKGDKEPGERHLLTATDAPNYRELQPNIKQLARKQQEKMDEKEVADTGLKVSRSNIFDDTNNGNDGKERTVSVIQQPTLKNKEKNTHGASTTKLNPLKPGAYSERNTEMNSRPVNTDDTIRGQKKISSPITGRANASVNVSQNKSKNAFKPDTDAKMDTESKTNTAETVSGQDTSTPPISGITYSIVDVSPTKPQTLDSKKQLNTGKDSETDAGMNSNPVYNVDRFRDVKNSRSPSSGRANATTDVDVINPKIQKSNFQTPVKLYTDTERKAKNSRLPISDITHTIVDVRPTNPQILNSNNQLNVGTDSESDGGIYSNTVNNTETVSGLKNLAAPISDKVNNTADEINPRRQSSNSQTSLKSSNNAEHNTDMDLNPVKKIVSVGGQETSRLPISGITNDLVDVSAKNPQILDSKNQFRTGTDSDSGSVMNSNTADSRQETLTSPVTGITDGIVDVRPTNIYILDSKNKIRTGTDSDSGSVMNSNTADSRQETSTSPVTGITDGIVDVRPTNIYILDSKNKIRTGTNSENDGIRDPNPLNNVDTVSGLKNSKSSISDRASSIADTDIINSQSPNSQNPYTHGIDVKSNTGMDSHRFNTSGTVRRLQTSKSPISDIIDAVNQTYPGTLNEHPFKPVADKDRMAEMDSNPHNKVETNSALEMPQLSVTSKADAKVTVHQINPQTVHSNSENATAVSSPVNKVETVSRLETPRSPISGRYHATTDQINPKAIDHISENPLKPGTISERKTGMHPNRDHTTDIVSQRETSESPISDSRPDISGTNPSLNSNGDLPKRQFLPKSKVNMTQPRHGQIKSPKSIDTERKKAQRNNKTTSLRGDAMTSGRQMPSGRLPVKPDKQQEIPRRPERISSAGIIPDPGYRKPYILAKKPVNKSKAFGSGGPKNTSGVTGYTKTNGTTHVDSRNISSHNYELNSTAYGMSQPIRPTLATEKIVDEAHVKRAKTAHTVEVLHTVVVHQIESTSQPTVTKPRLEKPGGSSGQDLVLESVNNTGKDSKPLVVEETKGADRRPEQTPFKTSSISSNQENHRNPFRVGNSKQNLGGKVPLVGVSRERNRLNYLTTAATPYTTKTDFKDKHSKMPRFTPPVITPPHFMDQDHEEQAKTTSGVKVSNKHVHHRLENPNQEIESKRSHSDTTNKELQSARNGHGSSGVTDFQANSLNRTKNRATGSAASIMDIVKASMGSKVSARSTESPNEEKARGTSLGTGQGMEKIEASTEANRVHPSSDNAPVKYNRYTKSTLGSTDSVGGNNGGHSIENNNGNSYPVAVNRMTGETLHKIPVGHTSNGDNKKALTVNNMDDRQGLEKQLLSNCQGQCDPSPVPSILNSRESSDNSRDKPPQDCSDFVIRNPTSGIYSVTPTGSGNRTFPVYCDMKSSGGGWTLIQHRFSGRINFNRTWNDYKRGFGNLTGEFWLGNDKMHWLTASKPMVLRIELEDLDGIKEYAQYDTFHVANESQYYRLTIEGYSGTAGDAMLYSKKFNHNQKNFTTPDRDNDQYTSGNCGAYYSSGWWFDACMAANLNGKFYETRYKGVRNGIFWGTWHNISSESYLTNERQSFKTVRMMIRPRTGLLMD